MKSRRALLFAPLLCLAKPVELTRALPGYRFHFPADFFDHRSFQTEWWYYTGNLAEDRGRRFGYELTFFRHHSGFSREGIANLWEVDHFWLAHFALSDIDEGNFYHAEKLSRSGPDLAGASAATGLIWNGNWKAQWHLDPSQPFGAARQTLTGIADGFAVDLSLVSQKPPVVHGRDGVSQKAAGAGRASHYVSLTRLATTGKIVIGDRQFLVEGNSWMDHEFFTHSLEANQQGWDWLSLQFEDGSELMLYRLRRKDGSTEPFSSGTFIGKDGQAKHLELKDFTMQPAGSEWASAASGSTYPLRWEIKVPLLGISGVTTTRLKDQEIVSKSRISPTYWEGAIEFEGSRRDLTLRGRGYLEMTGYAGALRIGE